MRQLAPCLALLSVALAACQSDPNSAQGTAERFVDQRYVLIHAQGAKELSTGLARSKIEKEERLSEGQHIDEATRKPSVRYKLLETRGGSEQPTFVFEGTVYVDDDESFTRRWLVTTRRESGVWKVSNFDEVN